MCVVLVADVDWGRDVELEGRSSTFKQHLVFNVIVFPSALVRGWRCIPSIRAESGGRPGKLLGLPSLQVCSTGVGCFVSPR
jgi:hypothetical protein